MLFTPELESLKLSNYLKQNESKSCEKKNNEKFSLTNSYQSRCFQQTYFDNILNPRNKKDEIENSNIKNEKFYDGKLFDKNINDFEEILAIYKISKLNLLHFKKANLIKCSYLYENFDFQLKSSNNLYISKTKVYLKIEVSLKNKTKMKVNLIESSFIGDKSNKK